MGEIKTDSGYRNESSKEYTLVEKPIHQNSEERTEMNTMEGQRNNNCWRHYFSDQYKTI